MMRVRLHERDGSIGWTHTDWPHPLIHVATDDCRVISRFRLRWEHINGVEGVWPNICGWPGRWASAEYVWEPFPEPAR